ncbi:MAG TPA: thioredoxin [Candidatus Thermoplasmatota archaeon]|nr:thioredoxin [Candidatus Thermoplasmatota archaeon]
MDDTGTDPELEAIRERLRRSLAGQAASPPADGEIVHLTDATFDATVSRPGVVVVDFWADWCMPCRAMEPAYKAAAKEFAGLATFAKLHVDQNPITASAWEIRSIPTVLVFKDGKAVDGLLGAVPKAEIVERVRRFAR